MDGIIDKRMLYSQEAQTELQKLTEKVGNQYFDAWDFGAFVDSVSGANRSPNPVYLGRIPYSHIKSSEDLWMVRMKEMLNVGPNLIEQKVLADVLHGAEHNKAWKDWAKIADMNEPKDQIPTISEDDFIVVEGTQGAKARYAGGKFGSVALDCSEDRGLQLVLPCLQNSLSRLCEKGVKHIFL